MTTATDTSTAARPFPAGSIVVGVDGSATGAEAVTWAAEQAAYDHRPLTLVHAYHLDNMYWVASAGMDDTTIVDEMREEGYRLLEAAKAAALETAPGIEVHEVLFRTDARSALIDASREAAMVVLGSRGRGRVSSLLLGSVGVAVVGHATCPVVVRRPAADQVRRGALVGTDLTDDSRPALEYAYWLASVRHLPLTVLAFRADFPWFGREAEEPSDWADRVRLAQWMTELGAKYPDVRVTEEDVEEPEARALVTRGAEKEIVVVGSHHHGVVASALGRALAVAVVEHAPTTVVVVPEGLT
jgi:nucleotide-binding universal stress UspA family protein